jgi:hypothetical protein
MSPGYYDMVTSLAASQVSGLGLVFKELKEKQITGFLLKSVAAATPNPMMKGTVSLTQVANSVEKHPIPASTFEPPAEYQKVTRPY